MSSNQTFLRDLQRRGVSFHLWNNSVIWADPCRALSDEEKVVLPGLRREIAAMLAKENAGPDVTAGVDARWEPAIAGRDWSWRPPRHVDPGRTIYSRPEPNADRKRGKSRAPPGEAEWQRTLGRQLDRLMKSTP